MNVYNFQCSQQYVLLKVCKKCFQIAKKTFLKRDACLNWNRSPGLENQPGENPPLIGTRDTTLQFVLSIVHFEVSAHSAMCKSYCALSKILIQNYPQCMTLWVTIANNATILIHFVAVQCGWRDRAKRVAHRWILMWVGRAQAFRTPLAFRSSPWSPLSSSSKIGIRTTLELGS